MTIGGETELLLSEAACDVGVAWGTPVYDVAPPFSPSVAPPEYPFDDGQRGDVPQGPGRTEPYLTVRESLNLLGLDAEHYGTPEWNPLGSIVRPGDTVVLKPNFVRDYRETLPGHDDCLVTHGSVIRAVMDYVLIALKDQGRIIVADAPQNDADFAGVRRISQIDPVMDFYRRAGRVEVALRDLRPECAQKIDGVIVGHTELPGDPQGYAKVNVGKRSAFVEVNHLCHLLYGSEYDQGELHRHQHDDVHEYMICKTVLEADCVISLPKLKTHKKAGLTVNMKNLVGINGNKNWLPHHREGTPSQGGDQFAEDSFKRRFEQKTVQRFKQVFPWLGPLRTMVAGPVKAFGKRVFGDTHTDTIRSGNWYGNDTTWRMVIDLNRILYYADAAGGMHDRPMRRLFSFVDGIIAGEGNGPMDATPRPTGLILAGCNPIAVDLVCARLMGFDYRKLPVLARAMEDHPLPLMGFDYKDVTARSNDPACAGCIAAWDGPMLGFRPHFGWTGHVEIDQPSEPVSA